MFVKIPHIFKQIDSHKSMLYAWFSGMHTRLDIVLCNQPEKELLDVISLIHAEIVRLERMGSFFDPEAELFNLNRSAVGNRMKISRELFEIIACCIEYNQKTKGYFDVTIHSENFNKDTIASVDLFPDESAVVFRKKGVKINLSGYLKGYALDKISRLLIENEISDALINLGNSSVMGLGNHPSGEGWKVGIDFPVVEKNKMITLHNECLTISGNNKPERKHIMDPFTGKHIEGIKGQMVVTTGGAEGEVLSTALVAAPEQYREEISKQFKINYREELK